MQFVTGPVSKHSSLSSHFCWLSATLRWPSTSAHQHESIVSVHMVSMASTASSNAVLLYRSSMSCSTNDMVACILQASRLARTAADKHSKHKKTFISTRRSHFWRARYAPRGLAPRSAGLAGERTAKTVFINDHFRRGSMTRRALKRSSPSWSATCLASFLVKNAPICGLLQAVLIKTRVRAICARSRRSRACHRGAGLRPRWRSIARRRRLFRGLCAWLCSSARCN